MLLYCKKSGPSSVVSLAVDTLEHPSEMFRTVVEFTDSYPNVFGSKNKLNMRKISSTKENWSTTGTDVQDYRFCFAEKATCAFIVLDEEQDMRNLSTQKKKNRNCK